MRVMRRVWWILAFLVIGPALIYLFRPVRCSVRETPHERRCLHQIIAIRGWTLDNYGGRLPPAVVVGPKGHLHSWRVLNPKVEALGYRLDEPWDSVHNRRVLQPFYKEKYHYCYWDEVARKDPEQETTSYVMLVRGDDPRSWDPNTLPPTAVVIVESAGCGIKFAEPRDLRYEDLWKGESPFSPGKLYAGHEYVHALRADGAVLFIPKTLPKDKVRLVLDGVTVEGVRVDLPN